MTVNPQKKVKRRLCPFVWETVYVAHLTHRFYAAASVYTISPKKYIHSFYEEITVAWWRDCPLVPCWIMSYKRWRGMFVQFTIYIFLVFVPHTLALRYLSGTNNGTCCLHFDEWNYSHLIDGSINFASYFHIPIYQAMFIVETMSDRHY